MVRDPRPVSASVATVYVLDDDDGMRRALVTLLSATGYKTAAFSRPSEFLRQLGPDDPGCVLLDIRMPEMSGLEVQRKLTDNGVTLPVIFMTAHADVPMAVQAVKSGAFHFIEKPFADGILLSYVDRALEQDRDIRQSLAERDDVLRRVATLSSRERQVMDMLLDGAANKVIAIDLQLSERTVEIQRARMMKKMEATSVAHLVRLWTIGQRTAGG